MKPAKSEPAKKQFEDERKALVEELCSAGTIRDPELRRAFLKVPREDFIPEQYRQASYQDTALPIGLGATISQPTTIAIMIEALGVEKGDKVLEVGSGSGYLIALLSEMVGGKGLVIGLEIISGLVMRSEETLKRLGYKNFKVVCADGSGGHADGAPYDSIIVSAAAPEVPRPLLEQLGVGAKLVIPVGAFFFQRILSIQKMDGKRFEEEDLGPFMFVPLQGKFGQK